MNLSSLQYPLWTCCILLVGYSQVVQSRSTELDSHRSPFKSSSSNATDMIVHEREFVSPLVKVQMDCQRDKTTVRLNFTKPFNGILSIGRLDTTKCRVDGDGAKYYEISVNHNATECEAQWDRANSAIFNTLFIRFHSSLETGSDIAKNIMCRLAVGELVIGRRPNKERKKSSIGGPQKLKQSTSLLPLEDDRIDFLAPSVMIPSFIE